MKTEITYSQTAQWIPFHPINISATAIVNPGEDPQAVLNELKRWVIENLDVAVKQAQDHAKGQKQPYVEPAKSNTIPAQNFKVPEQKTSIEQNLEKMHHAVPKTVSAPAIPATLPSVDPEF